MELEYDPLECFGRHLAATRRHAGVSQEALAYESGLSRSYVSEVERGLRNIALRNICILAKTLGVPPAQLLAFEPAPVTSATALRRAARNKVEDSGAPPTRVSGAGKKRQS